MSQDKLERIGSQLNNWLTIGFYLLAVASIVTFFLCRQTHPKLFVVLGVVALVLRAITYIIRLIKR